MPRIGIAVAVAVIVPVSVSAGPCKEFRDVGFVPAVLTPDGATLDQAGGVVVAAEGTRLQNASPQDPTPQDWRFAAGKDDAVGTRTVIAPGLVVVKPAKTAADLAFENADRSHVRDLHYKETRTPATPVAPVVDSVTYSNHDLPLMTRELTMAKLHDPPPAGAVALVVYAGDKPSSWLQITDEIAKIRDLPVWGSADCTNDIPGTIATRAGDKISLAWLDATGHLSPKSNVITVGR